MNTRTGLNFWMRSTIACIRRASADGCLLSTSAIFSA